MFIAGCGLALLISRPVATGISRATELICAVMVIGCLLNWVWPKRPVRFAVFGALGAGILFFACPFGPMVKPEDERAAIIAAAKTYAGTRYVWGGESSRGIDCSGLIRCAYRDAAVTLAIRHFSPPLARRATGLWWRDQAARDFENSGAIAGRRIAVLPTLRGETPASVLPGDVAIVGDGLHVLLYLGEQRWIQADPSSHTVHEDDSRTSRNIWLNGTATILRPGFLAVE